MDLLQWAPPERIAGWVDDATTQVLKAVADLGDTVEDDPRWIGPYLEIINPPVWELAHVAWFAELMVCRELHQLPDMISDVDALYDSAKVSHQSRWELNFPSVARSRDYVQRVGDAISSLVLDDRGIDTTAHFATYVVAHHDAHVEALTYTRQTLCDSAPFITLPTKSLVHDPSAHGDASVDGGRLLLGASRHQPFVQDNEKWAHPVEVAPFSMAKTAVSMADFRAFVNDGGYRNEALWMPEGWQWRCETEAEHPVYWQRSPEGTADDWQHRVFTDWRQVADDEAKAMSYVSWHEAQAFCTWANRRLPTEAEWEFAASTDASGDKRYQFPWEDSFGTANVSHNPSPINRAALDGHTGGVVDVTGFAEGEGPWGHRQLFGNVWEWTSDTFGPYPNFEPDHYRENSEPWFGTRKVLRGGSWATRSRYVRATFRNFFTPDRRDVIAGFRTCAR